MTRRYYAPDLPGEGGTVTLTGSESHHASRVMRAQVGDEIILFDGRGNEATGTMQKVHPAGCLCHCSPAISVDREAGVTMNFGIALPKPDRSRELIERLTELGVTSLTPLVAERSQRPPSPSLLSKLQRAVVEACKQCGRNRLMSISEPVTAAEYFRSSTTKDRWIADPSGGAVATAVQSAGDEVTVTIGPEGGWSETELSVAVAEQWQAVNLGDRIYRIETAATVMAALLATA